MNANDITQTQIESYLQRTGWIRRDFGAGSDGYAWQRRYACLNSVALEACPRQVIEWLAAEDGVDVDELVDAISKEPVR